MDTPLTTYGRTEDLDHLSVNTFVLQVVDMTPAEDHDPVHFLIFHFYCKKNSLGHIYSKEHMIRTFKIDPK